MMIGFRYVSKSGLDINNEKFYLQLRVLLFDIVENTF